MERETSDGRQAKATRKVQFTKCVRTRETSFAELLDSRAQVQINSVKARGPLTTIFSERDYRCRNIADRFQVNATLERAGTKSL
jgi:hypothetical protein